MLRLAEAVDIERLMCFLRGDAFRAKCAGVVSAYGVSGGLVDVWLDDTDETVSTVVVRFSSAVTLCCTDKTDFDELSGFVPVIGCSSLFAEKACFDKLGICEIRSGSVMKYDGNGGFSKVASDGSDRLRDIYNLISVSIPGSFREDDYLYWLSDMTYRQRRSLARVRCVTDGGRVAACALTSSESASEAVISGVAADSAFRGRGYGRRVVSALAGELSAEKKQVYVFVLNEEARGFYEHIGFTDCGVWGEKSL